MLASFLMLFVELALIRWTSANNLYLVHLTNFVLLASFLGIGLGFLLARSPRDLFALVPASLGALVAFVLAFPVQAVDAVGAWRLGGAFGMGPLPRWVSLPVIFLLTVAVLAGLGQEVARTFARFAPLEAYRLDVLGSLAGIAVFAGLSFLRLPPLAWAVLAAAAFLVLIGRPAAGLAGRRCRGHGGAARRPVAARRLPLVAVLQDPRGHRGRRQRQGGRQQHAPPDRPLARPTWTGSTPSTATRTRTCRGATTC